LTSGAPPPVARRIVVSGRVQGVFFRSSCQQQARAMALAGWVRNTSAGQVEAWIEGESGRVDHFVRWCREGPRQAEVDRVDVYDETPAGATGFRVR